MRGRGVIGDVREWKAQGKKNRESQNKWGPGGENRRGWNKEETKKEGSMNKNVLSE